MRNALSPTARAIRSRCCQSLATLVNCSASLEQGLPVSPPFTETAELELYRFRSSGIFRTSLEAIAAPRAHGPLQRVAGTCQVTLASAPVVYHSPPRPTLVFAFKHDNNVPLDQRPLLSRCYIDCAFPVPSVTLPLANLCPGGRFTLGWRRLLFQRHLS